MKEPMRRHDATEARLCVALERVERGGVVALAQVEVEIAGVAITLQGLKVTRGLDGCIRVALPLFEHNDASWPHVLVPDDLGRAIVDEIEIMVSARR